jgi:hypothetical protein
MYIIKPSQSSIEMKIMLLNAKQVNSELRLDSSDVRGLFVCDVCIIGIDVCILAVLLLVFM